MLSLQVHECGSDSFTQLLSFYHPVPLTWRLDKQDIMYFIIKIVITKALPSK